MDMIAITTIQRAEKPGKEATATSKAVPPKTETILAGASFTATAEEAEELIALKAARKDTSKKAAKAAPAKNTKTSSTAAAKQQAQTGEPKAPDDMTVPEIKAELDELEVEYASDALKDDLVKALTDARSDSMV